MVTMQNKMIMYGTEFPLKISIHRNLLLRFLNPNANEEIAKADTKTLALHIASVIKELAQVKPRSGREIISRPLAKTLKGGRICVPHEAWSALNRFFSEPRSNGNHLFQFAVLIGIFFFWGGLLRRVVHPARGRWAGKLVLGDYLPTAYFACRELVLMTKSPTDEIMTEEERMKLETLVEVALAELAVRDPRAQQRLEEAKKQPESYQDQILIVCLVYRAFEGAWDRFGVDGLPDPRDTFRRHLYRQKDLWDCYREIKKLNEAIYRDIVHEWIRLYLSEPGAAAQTYRLT